MTPKTEQDERKFLHDISSPLMIAIGYSEQLETELDGPLNEDQKLKLKRVLNSLHKISEFLKNRRKQLIPEDGE